MTTETFREEGTIVRTHERGFGFIAPRDGSGPRTTLFFHASALVGVAFDDLRAGMWVTFEEETDPHGRGPRAVDVRPVGTPHGPAAALPGAEDDGDDGDFYDADACPA